MDRRHDKLSVAAAIAVAVIAVAVIFLAFRGLEERNSRKEMSDASGDASADAVSTDGTPVITIGLNDYTYEDDITNFLIIGTDHSGSYTTGDKGKKYHGEMADFLMIISVNDTKGTYTLLPIDRDTMAKVGLMDTKGRTYASATEQICTAHWYGGNEEQSCENTLKAVSGLLGGLPIKGYYSIGMDQIKEINHAVGGVTVEVRGDFSQIDPTLTEGKTIRLSDDQAFTYVHERRDMPDDDRNSARMERQQQFMDQFIRQAKEQMKDEPSFANDLYSELSGSAVTDMNGHDVSYLINSFATKELTGTLHIEGKYREGRILDDDEPHGIFTADESSILDNLSSMLGLEAK